MGLAVSVSDAISIVTFASFQIASAGNSNKQVMFSCLFKQHFTGLQGHYTGAHVIKLFTAVIYHHSMVILSFCVIKLYYLGNYGGMVVKYHCILTLEKARLEVLRQFTAVLFYNIGPW